MQNRRRLNAADLYASRDVRLRLAGRVRLCEAEQAQRQLDVDGVRWGVPVRSQEALDPVQSLGDGVGVDMERLGARHQALPGAVVDLQSLGEHGSPPHVMVHHRA